MATPWFVVGDSGFRCDSGTSVAVHITGCVMSDMTIAILIALALAAVFWIWYLMKEIRDGKREFGPLRRLERNRVAAGPATPTGASDNNPGRLAGDPAPGQPDGQADPVRLARAAERSAGEVLDPRQRGRPVNLVIWLSGATEVIDWDIE